MTILSVRHITTYRYHRPVSLGEHRLMLRPHESHDQRLITAQIDIKPLPTSFRWIHDAFGNCRAIVGFKGASDELRIESRFSLEHSPSGAPDFQIEDYAKTWPFSYSVDEAPDLLPCIERRYSDPERQLDSWVRKFLPPAGTAGVGEVLATITHGIKESFAYARRSEWGTNPPDLTLKTGRGSCRDLALLMMEAVRCLGLAARFVSGYIYVPDRDQDSHLGGGATHAWCQVYLPGGGWIEFDPTNGIIGNRDLIRVAVARDPVQAIPISGTFYGETADESGMSVEVQVTTVHSAIPLDA
jgi:transglutaminase-like putative cysteine protease